MGFEVISRRHHQTSSTSSLPPYLVYPRRVECPASEENLITTLPAHLSSRGQSISGSVMNIDNSTSPQDNFLTEKCRIPSSALDTELNDSTALESSGNETSDKSLVRRIPPRQTSLPVIPDATRPRSPLRSASDLNVQSDAGANNSKGFGPIDQADEHVVEKGQARHGFLDPVPSVRYVPFGTSNKSTPVRKAKKWPEHLAVTHGRGAVRPSLLAGPLPSPSWPYAMSKDDIDKHKQVSEVSAADSHASFQLDPKRERSSIHFHKVRNERFDSWTSSPNSNNRQRSPDLIQTSVESSTRGLDPVETTGIINKEVARQRETVITRTPSPFGEKGRLRTANSQPFLQQTLSHPRLRPHATPRPQQRSQTMYVLDSQFPPPRLVIPAHSLRPSPVESPSPLTPYGVQPISPLPRCSIPVQYVPSEPQKCHSVYDPAGWPPSFWRRQTPEPCLRPSSTVLFSSELSQDSWRMQTPEPCLRPPPTTFFSSERYQLPSPQPRCHPVHYRKGMDDLVSRSTWFGESDGTTLHVCPNRYSHYEGPEFVGIRSASSPLNVVLDTHYDQRMLQFPNIRATRQFNGHAENSLANDRPHHLDMPFPLQGHHQLQRFPRTRSFHQSLSYSLPVPAQPLPGNESSLRSRTSSLASPSKSGNAGENPKRKSRFLMKSLRIKSRRKENN